MSSARRLALFIASLFLLAWPSGSWAQAPGPQAPDSRWLTFSAPPELRGTADSLARIPPSRLEPVLGLLGLREPGPPATVEIVPESSPLARNTPNWVSGYAIPSESRIVLFPGRNPGYPDGTLETVLVHEFAHVLIFRAANGHQVPRWFHEGLAMFAARERSVEDRARLLIEVAFGSPPSLQQLDEAFHGEPADVRRAYTISNAFFRNLVEKQGTGFVARALREAASGVPFDEAFRRGTGDAAVFSYFDFWQGFGAPESWLPVVTSTTVLWFAITVLALVAMKKRRKRDAAQRKAWEDEEKARRERLALEVLEEYEDEKPPN